MLITLLNMLIFCIPYRPSSNQKEILKSPEVFERDSEENTSIPLELSHHEYTNQLYTSLMPDYADMARNYFIHRSGIFTSSQLYLPQFLRDIGETLRSASSSSSIYQCVAAIGLSWLADHHELHAFRKEASAEYGRTLCQISKDIQDPIKSKSDITLHTVVLLTLYEVAT